MKELTKNEILAELFASKRVRASGWKLEDFVYVQNGQVLNKEGKSFDIMEAKEDKWVIWQPIKEVILTIDRNKALSALYSGKRVRAIDWDSKTTLFVKDGQIMTNNAELFNIMEAKEDKWIVVEEIEDKNSNNDKQLAEIKTMLELLLKKNAVTKDEVIVNDGRSIVNQANTTDMIKAIYGVTTPLDIEEQFKTMLQNANSSRDVQSIVCRYIPYCWIGGRTLGTTSNYYSKMRKVIKNVDNEYTEMTLSLFTPPTELYESVQKKIDDNKKAKIVNKDETFDVSSIKNILTNLKNLINGGDKAIRDIKTRQQTIERAKAYVFSTYLAIVTGRRQIEILKTLKIEKKDETWYYCGITKDREEGKCIKAYALDTDFVFLNELLTYVQEHIGADDLTSSQVNSKFNNPFNGALKKLTNTSFTFKDMREIYAEMMWLENGNNGSWTDEREYKAMVLGHLFDPKLQTTEHYMSLKGIENEK